MRTLLSGLPDLASEIHRLMSSVINEMVDTLTETWIILDDLHSITEPVVYDALDYLLARMPEQVRLLISTRHDPPLSLARLRARGQLIELRVPNLRFTSEEANQFLNDKQHLDLSFDDLNRIQARAEGWAAGLRLLAGSLDHMPSASDRSMFIGNLALTDRYVFDFLAEEALKRQEPEIRAFLLDTSILPELVPVLCNKLTERNDAETMVQRLYRKNLFLTQAGETSNIFRYHALFAEFLREQLKRENPQRFIELHRRAAEALKTSSPERAIAHYLAAEEWEKAAQTIEQASEEFLQSGYLRTLRGWIMALPPQIRDAHPRLLYLLGWFSIQRGELNDALTTLESTLNRFRTIHDQVGEGETLLLMIDIASRQHDFLRQAELTRLALAFPLPVYGKVQLLMAQVWQSLYQGDSRESDDALDKALELTVTSNDLRAFHVVAPLLNMHLAFLPGGTSRLEKYCRQVLSIFGDDIGLIQACAHSLLGYILFLQGKVDSSIHEVKRASAIFEQVGGLAYAETQNLYTHGLITGLRGEIDLTEKLWTHYLPNIEQTPMLRPFQVAVLYFIGRMQWMQRKFVVARQTTEHIAAIPDLEEYPETMMARRLMHVLIEISDRKFLDAESTLQQALQIEKRWLHAAIFGSARVLLAYLHLQCQRQKEAWSQFAPFLAECEQRNLPGLILQELEIVVPLLRLAIEKKSHIDYSKQLLSQLSAIGSPKPVIIPETGQTLTQREIEVLKLIAEGASNQVISQRLVISEHTVKVHITNIYAKLQVTSRAQAIARIHELQLI